MRTTLVVGATPRATAAIHHCLGRPASQGSGGAGHDVRVVGMRPFGDIRPNGGDGEADALVAAAVLLYSAVRLWVLIVGR